MSRKMSPARYDQYVTRRQIDRERSDTLRSARRQKAEIRYRFGR